jgi:hypothetical protein
VNATPLIWDTDILAAVAVVSAAVGYAYGAYRDERQRPHDQPTETEEEEEEEDSPSSDEESAADGDLSAVTVGYLAPCKLVRCSA